MTDHGPTWQKSGYYPMTGKPIIDIICDTCGPPSMVWPCQVVEKREGMDL